VEIIHFVEHPVFVSLLHHLSVAVTGLRSEIKRLATLIFTDMKTSSPVPFTMYNTAFPGQEVPRYKVFLCN
jgi:hypothetical protein